MTTNPMELLDALLARANKAEGEATRLRTALERIRDFKMPERAASEFDYYHSRFARDHARAVLAKS
jgi:hypothetical protein